MRLFTPTPRALNASRRALRASVREGLFSRQQARAAFRAVSRGRLGVGQLALVLREARALEKAR